MHASFLLRVLLALLTLAPFGAAQIEWSEKPVHGRLYPRNDQNWSRAVYAGTVTESGWDALRIELFANGQHAATEIIPLQYQGNVAEVRGSVYLWAGLIDYRVEAWLDKTGSTQQVDASRSVACGDVFLINGQSNSVAGDAWDENKGNALQSPWIRSYGTTHINGSIVEQRRRWYLADGDNETPRGAIGQWAIAIGSQIVKRMGVPVAILNGGVGATPIHWHMRVDTNPLDLGTIYGRLLWRAEASGLREHARAMFWYQGEANGGASAANYGAQFDRLIADWHKDYPALEKVYVVQVRQGCGVDGNSEIYEQQRQIGLRHPEVQMMSATALPAHDGCHYFHGGYRTLAVHLGRLLARDFYGRPYGFEIEPPDVIEARRTNAAGDVIRLSLNHAAIGMVVEPGAEADFQLADGAVVQSITVQGQDLLLQLDRSTSSGNLRFVGHSKNDGGRIMNAGGVGMLTFDVPLR